MFLFLFYFLSSLYLCFLLLIFLWVWRHTFASGTLLPWSQTSTVFKQNSLFTFYTIECTSFLNYFIKQYYQSKKLVLSSISKTIINFKMLGGPQYIQENPNLICVFVARSKIQVLPAPPQHGELCLSSWTPWLTAQMRLMPTPHYQILALLQSLCQDTESVFSFPTLLSATGVGDLIGTVRVTFWLLLIRSKITI